MRRDVRARRASTQSISRFMSRPEATWSRSSGGNKGYGIVYELTLTGGSGGSSGLGTFFTLTPSSSTHKEIVYSFTGATTASGGSEKEGTVVKPIQKPVKQTVTC
jgi:hypothetical protein